MTAPEPAGTPDLTEWYAGWRKGYASTTEANAIHASGPKAAAARVRLADANDHMSRQDMWSAGHSAGVAAGYRATSERLDGASEKNSDG
jgi:hypothetical protein